MTPTFLKKKKFENLWFFLTFWKVGVIPKEGWAWPRAPVLLLVWQRLRTLGTFLHIKTQIASHYTITWSHTHILPLLSRNTLQALRSAQEERRSVVSRSPTLPAAMKPQLDAELDEDGDMPFPDDTPGLILKWYCFLSKGQYYYAYR